MEMLNAAIRELLYVIGEKSEVPFSKLTEDDLDIILAAAINIGKKLKNDNGS